MFSAVLGLFSQDLAVDPGTSNTRVYLRGTGIVRTEPTVVSVRRDRRGHRTVLAIGEEAMPMVGRTPEDIDAVQPVRGGRIHDYEVAEAFLLHLMRKIHGRNNLMRPRMVVTVPNDSSEMELRAVRDSCESAGARDVHLVQRSIAAALGAQLPIDEPAGQMIVDLGGGSTDIAVISMNDVVIHERVDGGGEGMDQAVIRHLKREHALLVGPTTAEQVKLAFAVGGATETIRVKGRCMRNGIPRAIDVCGAEIRQALAAEVGRIAGGIRGVLDRSPPELASDVVDHGVVLVGGGANLAGLESALRAATQLPVVCSSDPEDAVISGAGRVLDELDLLRALAS